MNTKRLATAAAILGALGVFAVAGVTLGDPSTYPSTKVSDSPHNLNNYSGIRIEGNQVCLPCHIPHGAQTPELGERNLLWNHAETEQTFAMFSSSAGQPKGTSKLCLSCHDGVTALDSYGGGVGSTVLPSGDRRDRPHPIGVAYPTTYIGQRWNDPATFGPGGGSSGVRLVTVGGVKRVECHTPHNNGLGNFLRVPIEGSYLCLQCHIK
jgi:predicted CXXCH cytochrome family protein